MCINTEPLYRYTATTACRWRELTTSYPSNVQHAHHTVGYIYLSQNSSTIYVMSNYESIWNIYLYIFVAVNGGWSSWGPWVDCRCPGSTLSTGKMSSRTCTNPPPSNGGQTCQGSGIRRTKDCVPCPQGNKYLKKSPCML